MGGPDRGPSMMEVFQITAALIILFVAFGVVTETL